MIQFLLRRRFGHLVRLTSFQLNLLILLLEQDIVVIVRLVPLWRAVAGVLVASVDAAHLLIMLLVLDGIVDT